MVFTLFTRISGHHSQNTIDSCPACRGRRYGGYSGYSSYSAPSYIPSPSSYDALRDVSPLLGSRSGLNTADDPMAAVANKLAELVAV